MKITDLETQLLNLQAEKNCLLDQVTDLTEQLNKLSITPEPAESEVVSDEALRKRLMRLCSRKADGNLKWIQVFLNAVYPQSSLCQGKMCRIWG